MRAASHTIPCALGCGRALLWNALPVARAALGARWKDPTPELVKSSVNSVKVLKKVMSFIYHKGLANTQSVAFYFLIKITSYFQRYNIECKIIYNNSRFSISSVHEAVDSLGRYCLSNCLLFSNDKPLPYHNIPYHNVTIFVEISPQFSSCCYLPAVSSVQFSSLCPPGS